ARELQEILRGLGFYQGDVTGTYDESTKVAFRRFVSVENFEERWRDDDQVDREVINYMRRRYGKS
ncbi:MAG: putative peptidoglycan binding domain-containing protein, partial [bacterium]